MPTEIELKFGIEDPAPLRARLRELGCSPKSFVLETNRIFDTRDRRLLGADCGLRLRQVHSLDGAPPYATLTYKGARTSGDMKSREEIETRVSDPAAAIEILNRLGFQERVSYEKRRETWRLGPCEVVLDELPRLGWSLEIEGPSRAAIQHVQRELDLPDSARLNETYVEMADRHGDEDSAGCRQLLFED